MISGNLQKLRRAIGKDDLHYKELKCSLKHDIKKDSKSCHCKINPSVGVNNFVKFGYLFIPLHSVQFRGVFPAKKIFRGNQRASKSCKTLKALAEIQPRCSVLGCTKNCDIRICSHFQCGQTTSYRIPEKLAQEENILLLYSPITKVHPTNPPYFANFADGQKKIAPSRIYRLYYVKLMTGILT